MAEPTSSAAGFVATVGAFTLTLIGVGYYALVWAGVGAIWALYRSEKMSLLKAFSFALLSTLAGAAIASGVVAFASIEGLPVLIVLALVSGYGANTALDRLLNRLLNSGLDKVDPKGERK